MSDDSLGIKTELEDINEDEVKYDSDGPGRGASPGRPPSSAASVGSAGSGASSASGSRGRRRSWKKPKDKPKRPLSAYNIFFKHERSRIVEGLEDKLSPQEIVRSIEQILSTSRETRRHRRTHGKISFGDLARKIAEKWKIVDKERKAVFEHYAELDTRRYRRELKLWKDRKEQQLSGSMHDKFNNSISSLDGEVNDELSLDQLGPSNHSQGGHNSFGEAWGARYSMNSSFSSIDSEVSLEPIPINDSSRPMGRSQHSSMSGSLSGSGSFPSVGMEVGVPVVQGGGNTPGGVGIPTTAFSQLNVGGGGGNLPNMQNMVNMQNMQNMQPSEVALFNQQQQLLNNMQFGNMQNPMGQLGQLGQLGGNMQNPMGQLGNMGQLGQIGQMGQQMGQLGQMGGQQQQQQNLSPLDFQQQRRSLEEQRQQLLILQQQQQILQQQLIQQQNNLRMQQASLGQQQNNFVQQQQQPMGTNGGQPQQHPSMGGGSGDMMETLNPNR
eukprot:CAMPEP_0113629872 /NCGR_PEP_ID=MMETSP0017_2-20120614/15513_1 /TAXON_ID=2856 /ORGANISM="Cylindrotheca closterium" /LENGTH=494 /DNA_ID=CAMNT_0000540299 /DNA_START=5 /DNA_END=1489 /DNA_ORIENTATION=- /assembly_acc=CAM_ASM_000147